MRLAPPPDVPIVLFVDASWEVGGLTSYVLGLARGFRARGFTIAAICHPGEVVAPLREALAREGVRVHAVEEGAPSVAARLRRVRELTAVVRQYPRCVLALMMGYFTGGGVMTLAGVLGGAAAIVRADLQPPVPPITWRQTALLRLKDQVTRRVVVGAIENREAFARHMGRDFRKIDVVNTGIDLGRFHPKGGRSATRSALGYAPDDLVIGTSSRLSEERKGVHHFIDMAAQVGQAFPRAKFLIVGDGLLRQSLEDQAARLDLSSRVQFTGWRPDVVELLESMDVYVMPSLYEGGPTTVLEAMAIGLPVVATRVGMVPEVMDDGRTGLIVGPGDHSEMAAAVGKLLSDDRFRADIAKAARQHAECHFSINRMAEGYLEVFARAVGSA